MTVRRAFVLASDGASREWIYTAMSRGREANVLYLADEDLGRRAEIAPVQADTRTVADRLVSVLRRSDASCLAIDASRPAGDVGDLERRCEDAERASRQATARRRALESGWSRWLPHGRRELAEARRLELAATIELRNARRRRAEARHASRPPVPEVDNVRELDPVRERRAERRLAEGIGRDRGIER